MPSVTYSQIKNEIAHFIGSPESSWDSLTADAVESCIRTGVDKVIHNGLHQWTWMRPRWAWTTAADQRRYTLPSDFEQFVSDIYFDGVNYTNPSIGELPASRLMQLQADSTSTGTPTCFAIEPSAHDGVTEQGKQLVLHPTPDAEYQLFGVYQVGVRALSDAHPYPPGGEEHGELFLASCLAAAEAKFLDGPADKRNLFQEILTARIALDLRRQPRNLGSLNAGNARMRGRSDVRRMVDLVSGYTTYNDGTGV
jgi:hypothetical protein